ncbi:MAG: hypothetical protein LBB46_04585, partial [Coriobacteriaceae bacterium]|nr:hypothetical protein [Coriobacteriaceae bacterium]
MRLVIAAALVFAWPGLLSGGLPGAHAGESPEIIEFERGNPVYGGAAELGTPRDCLGLPETLRAVCPLPVFVSAGFVQTMPVPGEDENYDYYWYGYVAPRGAEELHAAGLPVVYTIYYADGRKSYRLHGTYDGANEGFYACDEQGTITGAVVEVPVTWRGKYNAAEEGTYGFIAKVEGFDYSCDTPTAEVAVIAKAAKAAQAGLDGDCCGEALVEGPCSGGEGCTHTGGLALHGTDAVPAGDVVYEAEGSDGSADAAPADDVVYGDSGPDGKAAGCVCPDGVHDPDNAECPPETPIVTFPSVDEGVPALSLDPGEGISIMPLGIGPNGGGANDVAQDDWMLTRAPTSGNGQYYNTQYNNDVPLPGIWIDYVNTIWLNKGVNKFDWTPASETNALNGWMWGGGTSNTTGNPQNVANAYPTRNGNTLTVYSGEQLRWALTNVGTAAAGTQTGGTAAQGTATNRIELGANINLNGNVRNWTTIYRTDGATITLTSTAGNHFTIYNMGIFQNTFGSSVGLYCSGQNSGGVTGNPGTLNAVRNFERFSMETCKVVAGQTMTMYGADRIPTDIAGTSVLGQHVSQRGNIYDVHVLKSLVFGDRRDYPNETAATGSNGSGSTFGTQLFMTGISTATTAGLGSSTIRNSSVEEGFVYGREHVISFMRGIRSGS